MNVPRGCNSLLVLVVIGFCCEFTRADEWPVPRGSSHEPVPYRYQPGQWKRVPKAFLEDAPACILYSGNNYLIEADGTVETIVHEITRLNSRKGIEKLGEYRNISYDPSYEKLTLNDARVLKANGQFVPIEPKHVQLRDVSTDYQVYDHSKQLVISFPNLEVGDAIEVKWTTRGKNPEYHGHFFTRYTFGDDRHPVVQDELRVRLPREQTFKYACVGGKIEPKIREDGDVVTYHWMVRNRNQLPRDENLPSKEDLRLQVACSTFASWDEIGKWKQRLRSDCWNCTPQVRKVVEEVTRDLKTPLEKARALTYWVRRRIRYVSSGEKHDFTPHAPAIVFENRYGDCKDQSQLLAVMLREAGIPVALVTLGTLDDGQILEEVPSPWGTHAILLVTIDGQEHWIDTTLSLAAWNYLPRDDRDRQVYVIDDNGLRLMRTPPLKPEDQRVVQTTQMSIGADGSSRSVRTLQAQGAAALTRRDDWVEVPSGERRRLMTTELQDANSKARLCDLSVDERALQDFDQPVSARLDFEIPGHFTGDSDREGSVTDSIVWSRLLTYNLDYDRKAALDLGTPFESIHRYRLELPPAYVLDSVPRGQTLRSPWGWFRLKVSADADAPRQIELEFHTRLEKTRVAPADFEKFRKFHEEVLKHYRVWLTLKPARDAADVPALEAILALTPGDQDSAATLVRLYINQGKYEEARRVLRRARSYTPTDLALAELTVKVAGDAEEEETAYRELIKRFPNEPRFAVALGQTLVNRAQYAEAEKVLKPLCVKGPSQWRGAAHYQLARGYLQQDHPDLASKHLEAAAKADPDSVLSASALQMHGRIHEKLGQVKEAAADYRQALLLDSESTEVLAALVQISLNANQQAEALDYLRRYTIVAAKDPDFLSRAADWHLRLGRLDDAFDLANRVAGSKGTTLAERTLGLVYLKRGNYARAVTHLEKIDPDAQVLEGLIRCHLALGQLRQAQAQVARTEQLTKRTTELARACATTIHLIQRRSTLIQSLNLPPDRMEAGRQALDRLVCAEQLYREGRSADQVGRLLSQAQTGGVEIGPVYSLRGLLSLEKGRLGKAQEDAERSIRLSPRDPRGYYVRGRIRLERGENGAIVDLAKAAELGQRKEPWVLHWLAAAMSRCGCIHEALQTQREALKLKPNDPELTEQLRELEKVAKSTRQLVPAISAGP